jgi:hypothetical protein
MLKLKSKANKIFFLKKKTTTWSKLLKVSKGTFVNAVQPAFLKNLKFFFAKI